MERQPIVLVDEAAKKPRQPREKLSLPLSPEITKAVQLIAKQYGHPQAEVLSDLAAKLQVRGIPFALAELSQKYDKQRREELAVALGTSIITPPAPGVLDDFEAQEVVPQETSVRPPVEPGTNTWTGADTPADEELVQG